MSQDSELSTIPQILDSTSYSTATESSMQNDSELSCEHPVSVLHSTELPTIVRMENLADELRNIGEIQSECTILNWAIESDISIFPFKFLIWLYFMHSLHVCFGTQFTFDRRKLKLSSDFRYTFGTVISDQQFEFQFIFNDVRKQRIEFDSINDKFNNVFDRYRIISSVR